MDVQTKNRINTKSVARLSMTIVVSIIAAKIVFIIFWSFTLFPGISDSNFIAVTIFLIGAIAGLFTGITTFKKINKSLKDAMQE